MTHPAMVCRRSERGSGTIALIVLVIICAAVSAAVLLPSLARQRAAEAHLSSSRAFLAAESGIDWAMVTLRKSGGIIPAAGSESQSLPGGGTFTVTYAAGTANGADDDGDTFVDEADESSYVELTSVGRSSTEARAIRLLVRAAVQAPQIESSLLINVDSPILVCNSRALLVDGREHFLDGSLNPSLPARPAVASPAPVDVLVSQICRPESFVGQGGSPSVGTHRPLDLNALVEDSKAAATRIAAPGTHSGITWGEPVTGGYEIVYCRGDLHLSGNGVGAGYLVVDGDLVISGSFTWHGVILVRGVARMSGGGHTKRVIGALVAGEEVETVSDGTSRDDETSTTVTLRGTVDLLYSSEAIERASERVRTMSIECWFEVPVP